ncbi:MAG: helicase C-terminal domain-containing protein, partial [Bacteroidota bacterium]|nr:helicase C-terminal domain-containing protein [Bacteroidota bacterium]
VGFSEKQMPIVKFNGISSPITMTFNTWASESIPSIGIKHMPLVLAWAMTIHKSQGTTLEIAEIDVGDRVFECGQTYVALSRVKSLEGLYLTNFNYQKVYTNKKVKTFYSTISDATIECQEEEN